jgi:hypothetical protein
MTSSTSPPRSKQRQQRKRFFHVTFTIEGVHYRVYPLQADPSVAVKAFRFKKLTDGATYDIRHDPAGFIECDCKGFQRWRHCKHCQTLTALGLLPANGQPRQVHKPEEVVAQSA